MNPLAYIAIGFGVCAIVLAVIALAIVISDLDALDTRAEEDTL
jgi:hypothetical protein